MIDDACIANLRRRLEAHQPISRSTIVELLDEIERLRTNRDHTCTCPHGDASEPLRMHGSTCPIRVNKLKRIAPEVAIGRLAAALDSGDEIEEAKARLANILSTCIEVGGTSCDAPEIAVRKLADDLIEMRGARDEACSMLDDAVQLRHDADNWFPIIAALRKVGSREK